MLKLLLLRLLVPARAPAQSPALAGQTIRLLPKMAMEPLSLSVNATPNGTIEVASTLVGLGTDATRLALATSNATPSAIGRRENRRTKRVCHVCDGAITLRTRRRALTAPDTLDDL